MSKHANLEYTRKPLSAKVLLSGILLLVVGSILVGIGYSKGAVYHAPIDDLQKYETDNVNMKTKEMNLRKENLTFRLTGSEEPHKDVQHSIENEGSSHHEAADAHSDEAHGHASVAKAPTIETRFWSNFLIVFLFVTSVGIGSLFLFILEYMVNANWSTPLRRVPEFMSFCLVFGLILGIVILNTSGFQILFDEWLNPVHPLVKSKVGYLNAGFFSGRFYAVFGLWILFYLFYRKNSVAQDVTRDQKHTRYNTKLAPVFMILFAFSITSIAIDFIMTLSPKWFSTMFGVAYFGGSIVAALGANLFAAVKMKENGYLHPKMKNDSFYSMSGLLFGFNCFWAYIVFCQFMLIWYSNIPEETFWYLLRWEGNWCAFTLFLIVFHFVLPFAMLVARSAKVNLPRLKMLAVWLMVAHYLDMYWQVVPTFSDSPFIGVLEVGFMIVAFGLVVIAFAITAKNKNHVPIGDPKLELGLGFRLH